MDCITRIGSVTLFGIGLLAGCSRSPSSDASTNPSATVAAAPATDAVAKAAADFLDAVLKGDTQRASARLTPQAMQRIVESGKQFSPPGLETASFRVGDVRTPSATQALVQCVLTDTSAGGPPRSEELCCLMRLVDNDWRVSGIAYGTSPNQPWTLSDFETGQTTPIPRQPAMHGPGGQPVTAGRPSPPRTAQESASSTVR